ncbi:MAG: hypothetical protein UV67_C0017G0018 [Parcubacteria group bacterium GW2011_GWC1_43_12]|nr:MAG: hypothetical protein UV67_C0017G0018 [Parcubacteria group bacterium GW2011_GWC1_43_12]
MASNSRERNLSGIRWVCLAGENILSRKKTKSRCGALSSIKARNEIQETAGAVSGGLERAPRKKLGVCSDGRHRVPFVNAYSDGDFKFNLGDFESDWGSDNCLLCFCSMLFFQPPSIRPISSNRRINLPYCVLSIFFCSQPIWRKNLNKSHLAIACETNDNFSNLSYAKDPRKISSRDEQNKSSIFAPIVYRSTRFRFIKYSCHILYASFVFTKTIGI